MDESAPRRVFRPAEPVVGGSLIGLARACAWDNRLPSVGVLLREATAAPHPWSGLATREDLDPARLATAMRIPVEEVVSRVHSAERLTRTLVVRSFFGAQVRSYDLQLVTRSFAPAALQKDDHHRAMWQLGLLPFCLETGEMLVHRCARCERRLEWGAAKPLSRCFHCGRPAATRSITVEPSVLDAGRLLFELVDPRETIRRAAVERLHPDLASLPPGCATDLAWSLGRLACELGNRKRAFDQTLPSETKISVIMAGAEMIAGWPHVARKGLGTLLESSGDAGRLLRKDVKFLMGPIGGWAAQRPLLMQCFPGLAATRREALRTGRGVTLNGASSLPKLQMTARQLPLLVQGGIIEASGYRRGRGSVAVLNSASVERLGELRQDCISFEAASERLGVPHHGVEQLLSAGPLKEHVDPAIAIMYTSRRVSKISFERLIDRIDSGAAGDVEANAVTLARALCLIGGRLKPYDAIFDHLLSGRLPYAMSQAHAGARSRPPLTSRLMVQVDDLAKLCAGESSSGTALTFRDDEGMTRRDVEVLLNISPDLVQSLLATDLKTALLADGRVRMGDALRLARECISFAEISLRFADGSRRLPLALRFSDIPRTGPAGWPRAAVEEVLRGNEAVPAQHSRARRRSRI